MADKNGKKEKRRHMRLSNDSVDFSNLINKNVDTCDGNETVRKLSYVCVTHTVCGWQVVIQAFVVD